MLNATVYHDGKLFSLSLSNPQYQQRLGTESSPAKRGLGLLVGERLYMSQQCQLAAEKDKHVLGCIQSTVGSRRERGS